jgi:hypothetical protein
MSVVTSLLDFLRNLLRDDEARAAFNADPGGYLEDHGFGHLSGEDVYDAMGLVCDTLPPYVAAEVANHYRSTSSGGNRVEVNQGSTPPPPPPQRQPGEDDLDAAIRQISYVTNNYSYTEIDDRDNNIDNSTNTSIIADGDVDFDQDIENTNTIASGDGAVAAGDDIEDSQVVTGDGNQTAGDDIEDSQNIGGDNSGIAANDSNVEDNIVGDENQVAVDSENVGFGEGDVTNFENEGDLDVEDGGALNVGSGEAEGEQDNSTTVEDSFNEETEIEDSFNEETDVTQRTEVDVEDDSEADVEPELEV